MTTTAGAAEPQHGSEDPKFYNLEELQELAKAVLPKPVSHMHKQGLLF